MSLEDDVAYLDKVPMLALLGKPALRILAIGAEQRAVPSGAVLFYAGDLADSGYVVQEGSFLLESDRPGKDQAIAAGPGTLIGELALLTDTIRAATATAQEPSTVMRIPRSLFMKMLEGYPGAAKALRDSMAQRLDQWSRELAGVKSKLETGLK